jgi:hypothetical protein
MTLKSLHVTTSRGLHGVRAVRNDGSGDEHTGERPE